MSKSPSKARGLGRGLSALMSDVSLDNATAASTVKADQHLPIEKIVPNPDQPRRTFAQDALQELAASIKEKGVIQPIIVRQSPQGDGTFEIVAGERRWRASQLAQLHEMPVLVRSYDDTEVLEIAIIENIQRADLNPMDEAAGYRQLMDRFGRTQEQMAEALGKSRSHIANLLRLLTLPTEVQSYLVSGQLTAGHARALVGHPDALLLAREVLKRKLSVRETEKLARKGPTAKNCPPAPKRASKDADTMQIESELAATLGMPVSIDHTPGTEGGKLTLSYKSLDQLDDLLRALSGG